MVVLAPFFVCAYTIQTWIYFLIQCNATTRFRLIRSPTQPNNTIKINYQNRHVPHLLLVARFLRLLIVVMTQTFRCLLCWLFISFALWLSTAVAFFKLNSDTDLTRYFSLSLSRSVSFSAFPTPLGVRCMHFNRHVIIGKVCTLPNKWLFVTEQFCLLLFGCLYHVYRALQSL